VGEIAALPGNAGIHRLVLYRVGLDGVAGLSPEQNKDNHAIMMSKKKSTQSGAFHPQGYPAKIL
jgi:hypothetical protein